MRFSIVVPTYNEEQDIAGTLESLLALEYDDKEILVVDDSTDATPEIVEQYRDYGVRLIRPGGGGRCEARNIGIRAATGDIVCILNADVRPGPDFLDRIAGHYADGADYVLVAARVSNVDHIFARYVGCVADARHNPQTNPNEIEWTEGFSCRRDVAIRAGLFPTGYPVPICAGEDGYFGKCLKAIGAKKRIDWNIVVEHVAPSRLGEFWRIRRGRGQGSAQVHRFLDGWSFSRIMIWNIGKTARTLLYLGTVIPVLMHVSRAIRCSPRGRKDLVPFMWAWAVEAAAFHVGEWAETFRIIREERRRAAQR